MIFNFRFRNLAYIILFFFKFIFDIFILKPIFFLFAFLCLVARRSDHDFITVNIWFKSLVAYSLCILHAVFGYDIKIARGPKTIFARQNIRSDNSRDRN